MLLSESSYDFMCVDLFDSRTYDSTSMISPISPTRMDIKSSLSYMDHFLLATVLLLTMFKWSRFGGRHGFLETLLEQS